MNQRKTIRRRLSALLLVLAYTFMLASPPLIYAQETVQTPVTTTEEVVPAPTTETTAPATTPTPGTTGPQEPTGPENTSYTYNPETGLWENPYYTWDPGTKKTAPKVAPGFSYNPETDHWDTTEWVYAPESGTYKPQTKSTSQPPASQASPSGSSASTATDAAPTYGPALTSATPLSISNTPGTGPASLNVTKFDSQNSGYFDLFFDADISHTVDSAATTGDASVLFNTTGGNASSGDAIAMANILNMIQSAWGMGGTTPNIYTADIQGDHYGDIIIDPDMFGGIAAGGQAFDELKVSSETDIAIQNNVNLLANSGNATVANNTTAGDATSGDATAVANIINLIQSSIAANESFMGIINVHGNLEGDILMSEDILDQLIAANVPSTQLAINNDGSLAADLNDNQTINNQITTTAASGNATVANNTTGGNATSGSAQTNVTVFNLTGRQVVGDNALLVFVNVSGEWVGFITNAPEGATAAALGSGITSNNADSGSDVEYDIDSDVMIENNVNVTAVTGDAEVSHNTTGGNATSGNATANANVANMINSSFSLGGFFGILMINIFGNWLGSYGTNTAYGNTPESPAPKNESSPTITHKELVARGNTQRSSAGPTTGQNPKVRIYRANFEQDDKGNAVLASASEVPPSNGQQAKSSASAPRSTRSSLTTAALLSLITVAFAVIFYGDRLTAPFRR